MRITSQVPDVAAVCEALLEGFVRAAALIISAGLAPPDPLDADVLYKPEPVGEEDWKLPHNVIRDGWGDCEDVAMWRAGGLRATGEDPEARVRVVKTGEGKLHAIVQLSDGSFTDPSWDLMQRQRGK